MKSPFRFIGLLVATVVGGAPAAADAQLIGLADEIIVISKGVGEKHRLQNAGALGRAPGAGQNPFEAGPAAMSSSRRRVRPAGALEALSAPGPQIAPRASPLAAAQPQISAAAPTPLFGPLDLPHSDYEGPANALTLEQAIERLVRESVDLRSKYYEIPQARADVLTAGLRGNPLYFLSASGYPYKGYSPARPGNNGYAVSVIQPVDINQKRQARAAAASQAVRVLEAQYQDAVRLAIDSLGGAFVDVVIARETVRYAEISHAGAERLLGMADRQLRAGSINEPARLAIKVQRNAARIGVAQAQAQLLEAKHSLSALLSIPAREAPSLDVRGMISDRAPPPPPRAELVSLALAARPDLAAFRFGIRRSQADVRVARKERIDDVFVVYSPYEFRNNGPVGGQNATSFSFGLLGSIPLFDRKQGEIRRSQLNVAQTRLALAAREREVIDEVERADIEYHASRDAVAELEREILPDSEQTRAAAYRLFQNGETGLVEYLNAQKDHNEIVRQYRDAVIRHRRSMLRLNTAVGRRILP